MKRLLTLILCCFHLYGEITMSHPFAISNQDGLSFNPCLVMNSSGDAGIAWRFSESSNENLIQTVMVDLLHQKWSSPHTLSTIGANAAGAAIAMDSEGNTLVTWQVGQTIESSFFKKSLDTWLETKKISTSDDQAAYSSVTMNGRGDALVLWSAEQDKNSFILKSRSYDSTTEKWSPILKIGLSKKLEGDFEVLQQAALDSEGNAVAIWTLNDPHNNYQLKTGYLKKNGFEWLEQEILSGVQSTNSSLAMTEEGEGIALWTHFLGQWTKSKKMQAATYDAKTQKWHAISDITNWKDSIFNGGATQIAMNESGDAIGVWQAVITYVPYIVRAACYDSKERKWSAAIDLSSRGANSTNQQGPAPAVAIDKSGNGAVLWSQYNENKKIFVVQLAIYDAEKKVWSEPFDISKPQDNCPECKIAMTPDGRIIAIWNEYDGKTSVIKASVGQLTL